jgi:hypothetical protein
LWFVSVVWFCWGVAPRFRARSIDPSTIRGHLSLSLSLSM